MGRKTVITEELLEQIINLLNQGLSVKEISKEIKLPASTIYVAVRSRLTKTIVYKKV